ncbi:C40 family peptidase [Actinomadura atramentaria]|uniref:C40 family peptidase n=1 Tax=Actinomadura atramentaria TaxID=1990 RepID=UPI0003A10244|nr:NlpC/P60 family protein [Actinomadura atramentaria]
MEPLRRGSRPVGKHRRPPTRGAAAPFTARIFTTGLFTTSLFTTGLVSTGLAASGLSPVPGIAPPAHADPAPPGDDLAGRAHRLADRLEQLTEQYNGLRVKLREAQQAARTARASADRQHRQLDGLRDAFSGLAADAYMQSGTDPASALFAARDPQTVLDQSATLRYFATQNGTRVQTLVQAMQAAERARRAAEDRAAEVTRLRGRLDAQRDEINEAYEKVRGKLVAKDPEQFAKLPVFGAGRAAEALRIAMAKVGRPYVWGAAGPTSFDCSGLTMWAYRQVGVRLPHYTGSQWHAGVHVSRSQLRPGDLVFFYSDLHHVGMYVGGGKMLHAPHTGDVVRIAPIAGRPFAGAVRVA